jgi:hypothetical protein
VLLRPRQVLDQLRTSFGRRTVLARIVSLHSPRPARSGDFFMSGALPTPRTTVAAKATCAAICEDCQHTAALDLPALTASGRGDVPLLHLKLRCARCGSRKVSISVSGRSTGW